MLTTTRLCYDDDDDDDDANRWGKAFPKYYITNVFERVQNVKQIV